MRVTRYSALLLVGWLGAAATFGAEGAPAPEGKRTLAVLYFQNNAMFAKESLAPLEKGLTDMLITALAKIEALQVVERVQLQQLTREMGLGASGAVSPETAQEMGKLLGAEALLLGSFATDLSGKKLRVDARIVETETGVILKAEEVTDRPEALFKIVDQLTRKIAKNLEIKLTREDKQRLEKPENESFQATLLYAQGLDYEDEGDREKALEMYRQALAINPDYTKARERLQAVEQALRQEE